MLTTVRGHYNGTQIILDEDINLLRGQELMVTVLDIVKNAEKKNPDLSKYMGRGEKMFTGDAQEYVRELRADDRI